MKTENNLGLLHLAASIPPVSEPTPLADKATDMNIEALVILSELVRLKKIKDNPWSNGKDMEDYTTSKPKVWDAAFKLVERFDSTLNELKNIRL